MVRGWTGVMAQKWNDSIGGPSLGTTPQVPIYISQHTTSDNTHRSYNLFCSVFRKHAVYLNVYLLFLFLLCVNCHIKRWEDGVITMSEDNSAAWSVTPGSVWHQWASCYTTCQKQGHNPNHMLATQQRQWTHKFSVNYRWLSHTSNLLKINYID